MKLDDLIHAAMVTALRRAGRSKNGRFRARLDRSGRARGS
jgi:hypothetical protein